MRRYMLSLLVFSVVAIPAGAQRRHASKPPPKPPAACFSATLTDAATETVAVDDDFVYYGDWGESQHGIFRVAKTGGAPQRLASFPCCVSTLMILDSNNVYVAVRPNGDAIHTHNDSFIYTIYSIAKDGSAVRMVADGVWSPKQLALDGGYLYWVSLGTVVQDPHFASDGKVERADKDGLREVLASGLSGPTSIALDDQWIYFTESGLAIGNSSTGVRRIPKNGGSVQRLYNQPVYVIALNGNDLYMLYDDSDSGKTKIVQGVKTGGTVKHSVTDSLIINNWMTIFDGRLYYYTQTPPAFGIASTTLDLQGRIVQVGQHHFNGDVFAIDGCAFYISTTDQEVERVVR
jgi:hypothetical protein